MRASPWRTNARLTRRQRLVAALVVGALIAGFAIAYPLLVPARMIAGRAEVVDGDTLRIDDERIRLLGLDAPELAQDCSDANGAPWACGEEARAFVISRVAHRTVSCQSRRRDTYGRALAKCDAGEGDLGAMIVAAGWAVPEFDYGGEGASAQSAKLGIWSGSFMSPAEWRREHGQGNSGFWDWITSWLPR